MDNKLEVIKTLYENKCQRIAECIDNNKHKYIYNTIINQNLIKLIDISLLNNLDSNIIRAYKTDDRLYIVTKPFEECGQLFIKDYVDNNKLTLKQQFNITEQLINLFISIEDASDLLQYKILNFSDLCIQGVDKLIVNGYFEFKDEYDLSDNFTYKNLGNILHYIFSGEEIVDYNLSDSIPPDILKIIVKCLTHEYFSPKDILKELINSPIYGMIYCKIDGPSTISKLSEVSSLSYLKIHKDYDSDSPGLDLKAKNDLTVNESDSHINAGEDNIERISENYSNNSILNTQIGENAADSLDDSTLDNDVKNISTEGTESRIDNDGLDEVSNQKVIDIYLSKVDEVEPKKNKKSEHGNILSFMIPVCVIGVIVFAVFFFKDLYKDKAVNTPNVSENNQGNNKNDSISTEKENNISDNKTDDSKINDDNANDIDESLFLNAEILEKIKYEGNYAKVSKENYNEGKSSFVIENTEDNSIKSLFAVIDLTTEEFRLLQNNTITLSAMFKAFKDTDAKLIIEAYKNGEKVTEKSGNFSINSDIWIVKTASVVVGDIDRINLYIEYVGQNKVWVDSISADIQK